MIRFKLTQVNPESTSTLKGKYVPHVVIDETYDIAKLAEHMSAHNSPFSKGALQGMITDMVACIRELILDGKNVKLDNLAIFSAGLDSKVADTKEEFSIAKHINGIRLRARATGDATRVLLTADASLKEIENYNGGDYATDDDVADATGGEGGSDDATGSEDNSGNENTGGQVTLTLVADPANGGSVSGAGTYAKGESVQISAKAEYDYEFEGWSDGDTNATRTIVVNEDMELTAEFRDTGGGLVG